MVESGCHGGRRQHAVRTKGQTVAIYHGSVRRPVALQRSDSPIGRGTPSPTPSSDSLATNESAPTTAPVSTTIVAEQSPATGGAKKKRSRSAKSGTSTVGSIAVPIVPSGPTSGASLVPNLVASAVPAAATPVLTAAPPSESVEHLLQLPRGELARLLAEADGSANRVWLALIYRLSALESQVTELAAALRSAAAPAAKMPVAATRTGGNGDGRPDVLEQVFRKNLSLRKSGGE